MSHDAQEILRHAKTKHELSESIDAIEEAAKWPNFTYRIELMIGMGLVFAAAIASDLPAPLAWPAAAYVYVELIQTQRRVMALERAILAVAASSPEA